MLISFKNQMQLNKIILIYLFLSLIISCRSTEEDKHPDVPFLDEKFSDDLHFEDIGYEEKFINDTDVFIYTFFLDRKKGNNKILVRDKESKKVIKEIFYTNHYNYKEEIFIDPKGNVYYLYENSCYKLTSPTFNKIKIKSLNVGYLNSIKIEKESEEAFEKIKLDSTILSKAKARNDFIKNRQKELIENKLFNDYENIISNNNLAIITYKNKEEYFLKLDSGNIISGFQVSKDKNIIEENIARSKSNKFESDMFSISHFDDSILLEYEVSYDSSPSSKFSLPFNSNSKYLHYYEIKTGNNSFKCKSSYSLKKAISFNEDMLVSFYGNTYKVTLK